MDPDDAELVVLLDPDGRPQGTMPKGQAHGSRTPFHLGFSCYAFGPDDRLLLTRRATTKRTFPGVWSNSCCGHPGPGEALAAAVHRRLAYELGLAATLVELVLPEFAYRASAAGVEENELCPVLLARVTGQPQPRPDEVAEVRWIEWPAVVARAQQPDFSAWARLQVPLLLEAVPRFLAGSAAGG